MTTFKILYEKLDADIHFRVYAGKIENGLWLCGSLVMREEEFQDFKKFFKEQCEIIEKMD